MLVKDVDEKELQWDNVPVQGIARLIDRKEKESGKTGCQNGFLQLPRATQTNHEAQVRDLLRHGMEDEMKKQSGSREVQRGEVLRCNGLPGGTRESKLQWKWPCRSIKLPFSQFTVILSCWQLSEPGFSP